MGAQKYRPIFQQIVGVQRVGKQGKREKFDHIGIFSPDRSGKMKLAIRGRDSRPIYLDLDRLQAQKLAEEIMYRLQGPNR